MEFIEGLDTNRRAPKACRPWSTRWHRSSATMQESLSPETPARTARRSCKKMLAMDPEAFVGFARALNTYPSMVEQLQTIACPTTVIVGENDDGLRDASEVMATEIPDAELVVIADAGHSPQEDDPAAWLAAVEQAPRTRS